MGQTRHPLFHALFSNHRSMILSWGSLIFCAFLMSSHSIAKVVKVRDGDRDIEALPSTYKKLEDIGNVHSLTADEKLIRGATPITHSDLLIKAGVTDVLIFRSQNKTEVDDERRELKSVGFKAENIHYVPFNWRKIKNFQEPCRQVVTALQIMKDTEEKKNSKLFFHCSMGEDRTGIISGLYRQIFEGWSPQKAFKQEMCAHGYAEANRSKPLDVAKIVNSVLTPVFAGVSLLVESGALSKDHLDMKACDADPFSGSKGAILKKSKLVEFDCEDNIIGPDGNGPTVK